MRRRTIYAIGVALLPILPVVGFAPAASAASTCPEYVAPIKDEPKKQVAANMDGLQVVGGGDPDGRGTVLIGLLGVNKDTADISFQVSVNNVALPLEGAHVHRGTVGTTGVAAVNLFTYSDQSDRSGVMTISKCMGLELVQRPQEFYVDVHNSEYPDQGAVRGQLQDAR